VEGGRQMNEDKDKELLKVLYLEISNITLDECKKCRAPLSCCSREYCFMARDWAKDN